MCGINAVLMLLGGGGGGVPANVFGSFLSPFPFLFLSLFLFLSFPLPLPSIEKHLLLPS